MLRATVRGYLTGSIDLVLLVHNSGGGERFAIADYKTNRPVPENPPDAYVAQLALYREVLRKLYPNHAIRAALTWTYVSDLVEVSDEAMDAALAAVTRP